MVKWILIAIGVVAFIAVMFIGVIVVIRSAGRFNRLFDSYWVVWCDGTSPEWCDKEEVSLYEDR